jgi:hypothetical protein
VNVDYYADSDNSFQDGENYPYGPDHKYVPPLHLPNLVFEKQENFGYSTNGQQFVIVQGDSYTVVEDSFGDTTAKILAGTNDSTTTDKTPAVIDDNDTPEDPSDDITMSAPRALVKTVNTGWVANPDPYTLMSDILSLWGMSEVGAGGQTDNYVLSISFGSKKIPIWFLINGTTGIVSYVDGEWVNAVDENFGGEKKYVLGKYKPEYGLGTYGIDPIGKTAWAVLNYNADFAAAMGF